MMTMSGRIGGEWQGCGRDFGEAAAKSPGRCNRPSLWGRARWAFAIFVGMLSGGQCLADEELTLTGDTPAVIFDDDTGTDQVWRIIGTDASFRVLNSTAFEIPFVISPDALDNALVISDDNIGMGTSSPQSDTMLDIRSSFLNGILLKRAGTDPHYIQVETTAGVFRSGVQGTGDAQFGAMSAGKGLNLLAGGSGKLLMNSSGQISFGSTPPAITTHHLVDVSGAHLTSGGAWMNASSRAVKQDIEPITSEQARDTVRALQPVGYRYKNELGERYVGFIAEDVPELVATNDRKNLAPMDITAVLTKVVQDQDKQLASERERNDRQQQLIDSLSKRLADLERKSD